MEARWFPSSHSEAVAELEFLGGPGRSCHPGLSTPSQLALAWLEPASPLLEQTCRECKSHWTPGWTNDHYEQPSSQSQVDTVLGTNSSLLLQLDPEIWGFWEAAPSGEDNRGDSSAQLHPGHHPQQGEVELCRALGRRLWCPCHVRGRTGGGEKADALGSPHPGHFPVLASTNLHLSVCFLLTVMNTDPDSSSGEKTEVPGHTEHLEQLPACSGH